MNENHVYVLLHSPLVGVLTWTLVADEIRRRGLSVAVPILKDAPDYADVHIGFRIVTP